MTAGSTRSFIVIAGALLQLIAIDAHAAPAPKRVLLVLAHPDDETMIGGLLGRLRERGVTVNAIYVTDGEGGKVIVRDAKGKLKRDRKGQPMTRALSRKGVSAIREGELAVAARRFGFGEVIRLKEPDAPARGKNGKPGTDVRAFRRAKHWNVGRIKKEIASHAAQFQPDIVVTMLPKHRKIHAHHKLVGQIVLELNNRGRLGPRAKGIYGIQERDWYRAAFAEGSHVIKLPRTAKARGLGFSTYGAFWAFGAKAHQSQPPGHPKAMIPGALKADDVLQRLDKPAVRPSRDPLRRIVRTQPRRHFRRQVGKPRRR